MCLLFVSFSGKWLPGAIRNLTDNDAAVQATSFQPSGRLD
jgi:hypothetical protein